MLLLQRLLTEEQRDLRCFIQELKPAPLGLSGADSGRAVRQHQPDILILDIRMPAKNGFDVLRETQENDLPTLLTVRWTSRKLWRLCVLRCGGSC